MKKHKTSSSLWLVLGYVCCLLLLVILLWRCVFKSLLLHGRPIYTIDVICSSNVSYVIYDLVICSWSSLYVTSQKKKIILKSYVHIIILLLVNVVVTWTFWFVIVMYLKSCQLCYIMGVLFLWNACDSIMFMGKPIIGWYH